MKSRRDVELIRQAVERRLRGVGRVSAIVNYDDFELAADVGDDYAKMVRYLMDTHYDRVSRYTKSAFLRVKLGEALSRRDGAPHLFETPEDAREFLGSEAPRPPRSGARGWREARLARRTARLPRRTARLPRRTAAWPCRTEARPGRRAARARGAP